MAETAAARRARLQREAEKTKQAEADARARQAEADAAARRAEADAKREQARIEAEAESRRLDAQRQQAELAARQETERRQAAERQEEIDRQNAPLAKAFKVGINLTAPVAGYLLGKKMAAAIEARHIASQTALTAQATKLAKAIPRDLGIAQKGGKAAQAALDRLTGAVVSAERAGLSKVRGPLGLVSAGLLLGEGAFSRFYLAPGIENEAAKDTVSSLGVGSLFAASALVGQRLLANATPTTVIPPTATAKIEAARSMLARLRPEALVSPGGIDKLKAAGSNKATAVGALLLTAGAGIYGLLSKANAAPAPTPADAMKPAAGPTSLTVAQQAAGRVAQEMTIASVAGSLRIPASEIRPDGMTDDYVRQQNGKQVRVTGYRTPTR